MELLNKTSYEVVPDKLIIDSRYPIDVKIVKIKANQGIVKRGTILSLVNPTNEYVVYGSTLLDGQTAKANCVVSDDIDTASTGTDVGVSVYISGHLNKNLLMVKDGATLSTASLEDLRASGLFVSSSIN